MHTMFKLTSFHYRLTSENPRDGAQDLGSPGTPYFRYDASHHLHKQIARLKPTRRVRMLLLAVQRNVTARISTHLNR